MNPIFSQALAPFAPVSPYVAKAAAQTRTEPEARAEPFLTQPFWLVLVEPRRGEYQSLAMEWPDMTNVQRCLHVMRQSLGDENAYVIAVHQDGTRTDVSDWFASLWLAQLKDEGFSRDEAMRIKFISRPQPNAPAPFTPDLRGLILWLETMPEDEYYEPCQYEHCLFGNFHRAIGRAPIKALGDLGRIYPNAPGIACFDPFTYGAALKRARAALSESEKT